MGDFRRSEHFQDSYSSRTFELLEDDRTVLGTFYKYEHYSTGYRKIAEYEVACLVAPAEFLPLFFRQLNETLIGWRGYGERDRLEEYPYGKY